jgi:hypothetical protein
VARPPFGAVSFRHGIHPRTRPPGRRRAPRRPRPHGRRTARRHGRARAVRPIRRLPRLAGALERVRCRSRGRALRDQEAEPRAGRRIRRHAPARLDHSPGSWPDRPVSCAPPAAGTDQRALWTRLHQAAVLPGIGPEGRGGRHPDRIPVRSRTPAGASAGGHGGLPRPSGRDGRPGMESGRAGGALDVRRRHRRAGQRPRWRAQQGGSLPRDRAGRGRRPHRVPAREGFRRRRSARRGRQVSRDALGAARGPDRLQRRSRRRRSAERARPLPRHRPGNGRRSIRMPRTRGSVGHRRRWRARRTGPLPRHAHRGGHRRPPLPGWFCAR